MKRRFRIPAQTRQRRSWTPRRDEGEFRYGWVSEPTGSGRSVFDDTPVRTTYDWKEHRREMRERFLDKARRAAEENGEDWREVAAEQMRRMRVRWPDFGKGWWSKRYLK